ncbi:MAG TPA: MopE-related protein [Candidatus Polarisedimenticolaceae bacterium]|nr:MopE-related protein [Candidatus Polarisedimenticolaceae bacterium]
MPRIVIRALVAGVGILGLASGADARPLGLEERVDAQRAIERVLWEHRLWPAENPGSKPPLSAVMGDAAIRAKVEKTLARSEELGIVPAQLQAEMDRMAARTRDPRLLRALFAALGDDPFLIAETLARQTLVERGVPGLPQAGDAFASFVLPELPDPHGGACPGNAWEPTLQDLPDGRYGHSAVWTGSEMIVWGGQTWSSVATGARYSPATDSWTATSTGAGVSEPRANHTAVWTGTEMIVWGGQGCCETTGGSGGRYNPSSDTWAAVATTSAPSARSGHTAVWTGTQMVIWGGSTGAATNTGGRYTPATNSWLTTSTTGAPVARFNHTAVWTGTVMIVWGGHTGVGATVLNTGSRYNPATNAWTATSTGTNLPEARNEHSAVWTGTVMIVWGGTGTSGWLNTGGRYNPTTNAWLATSTGTNAPPAKPFPRLVWTGTEMIVWGGLVSGNVGGRYNPTTNTWLALGNPLGLATDRGTAVWTGTEMIAWGGGAGVRSNDGGRYDPASDTWVPTSRGTVPRQRTRHATVWTGSEMVVWGGTGDSTGGRYTPATDSWAPTSTGPGVPSPRSFHVFGWTGKEMLVWGGVFGGGYVTTGGRYDPATDSWLSMSTAGAPSGRTYGTAVWTGRELAVWGGFTASGVTNTGGRYDPIADAWVATSTVGAPAARAQHTAVWTGGLMLVWGPDPSGGRYDPGSDTWSPISTVGAPEQRTQHSAVWTGQEMIVYGGTGGPFGLPQNTGARYSPASDTWQPTATTSPSVPLPRAAHAALWTGDAMLVSDGGTADRYDPATNSWQTLASDARIDSRALPGSAFTGTEWILWGGEIGSAVPTASGGRYCACPGGTLVYLDVDGDGYGAPGTQTGSCDGSVPAGYAANQQDCRDDLTAVHPGAAEVCNGRDDDCDLAVDEAVPAPSGSPALALAGSLLSWSALANATGYDLVRGDLSALRASGGDFSSGTLCVGNDLPAAAAKDPFQPAVNEGAWYLVRAVSACTGAASYDEDGGAQQGARDPEIATAPAACP